MQTPPRLSIDHMKPKKSEKELPASTDVEIPVCLDALRELPPEQLAPIIMALEAQKEAFQLVQQINELLGKLAQGAVRGSSSSIAALAGTAVRSTELLNKLAKGQPELFRPLASTALSWPVVMAPTKSDSKKCLLFLKWLTVATDRSGPIDRPRLFRTHTLAREFAREFVLFIETVRNEQAISKSFSDYIEKTSGSRSPEGRDIPQASNTQLSELTNNADFLARCSSLPPLSNAKTDVDAWMEVIRYLLLKLTNNHPERDATLRELGQYRRKHTETGGKGSEASDIRDGIFTRMSEAVAVIVGKTPQRQEQKTVADFERANGVRLSREAAIKWFAEAKSKNL